MESPCKKADSGHTGPIPCGGGLQVRLEQVASGAALRGGEGGVGGLSAEQDSDVEAIIDRYLAGGELGRSQSQSLASPYDTH